MMPLARSLGYDLGDLAAAVTNENRLRYRFNYVVMAGFNDRAEDLLMALKTFEAVQDRSVVRVSRLNPTSASVRNGLRQPPKSTVDELATAAGEAGWDAYPFYSTSDDGLNCGQLSGQYLKLLSIRPVSGAVRV